MRKVFFSFHYENDVFRSNVVRNSWVTRGNQEAGFVDKAEFEKVKMQGEDAIYKWIDKQLGGTSVTVVLIGEDTCNRKYVRYELQQSYKRGNAIIGIYIHNIKDARTGKISLKGDTTFGILGKDKNGNDVYFYQVAKTYDWINDNGYENIGIWVEKAFNRKINDYLFRS